MPIQHTNILTPLPAAPNAALLLIGSRYLRVFDAPALQFGAEDFSVLAWVNPTGLVGSGQNWDIISKDSTTGYRLFTNGPNSGKFSFGIRGFSPFANAGVAPQSGVWYMAAGGHDQSAAQIWASVNGATPSTTSRATAPTAGTTDLAIGTTSTFSGVNFTGSILRAGIWRRNITSDLATLYNGGYPLRYEDLSPALKTSLEAWWDMNEGTAQNRREVHAGLYHGFDQQTGSDGVLAVRGIGPIVTQPTITKKIVCDGDSLTAGFDGATYIPNFSYPSQSVLNLGSNWQLVNIGVSGYQTSNILANVSSRVDSLSNTALTKNILVLWIGTNDLLNSVAVATIESNIASYISGRQSAGFSVVICTLTPSQYASRPGSYDANRLLLNTWINAGSSGANAVCDSGNNATLSDPTNTTYYNADKLHLTRLGYKVVCGDVVTTVLTL